MIAGPFSGGEQSEFLLAFERVIQLVREGSEWIIFSLAEECWTLNLTRTGLEGILWEDLEVLH